MSSFFCVTGKLGEGIRDAARSVIPLLISTKRYKEVNNDKTPDSHYCTKEEIEQDVTKILPTNIYPETINDDQVCLVQNLTTGAATVALRWANQINAINQKYIKDLEFYAENKNKRNRNGSKKVEHMPNIHSFFSINLWHIYYKKWANFFSSFFCTV